MAKPTESELKILQILWERGASSVREVHQVISQNKESGYTTTLKLMQIMTEKGLTTRDTSSKTHIYIAHASESNTKRDLLQSFIFNTFKGSAKSLVLQALGNEETSKEDLDEIKSLIRKIENQGE